MVTLLPTTLLALPGDYGGKLVHINAHACMHIHMHARTHTHTQREREREAMHTLSMHSHKPQDRAAIMWTCYAMDLLYVKEWKGIKPSHAITPHLILQQILNEVGHVSFIFPLSPIPPDFVIFSFPFSI